jgi:hypothetical protein
MAAAPVHYALSYEEGGRTRYVADKHGRALRFDYAAAHSNYDNLRQGKSGLLIVDYSDVPEALRAKG